LHIAELSTGTMTDALYLVADRSVRAHKNKPGQYLQLQLQDRTGTIKAMYWDVPIKVADSVRAGDVYLVSGKVENYMDDLQIRVTGIREPTGDIDWSEFLPESAKSAQELETEFDRIVALMEDPDYRAIVEAFRNDDKLWPRFTVAPAATAIHHAYLRGLMEHTLNLCNICERLCTMYHDVNRDLLLAGAIFHDLGKAYEYESGPTFKKTLYGELVGHLAIGDQLVVKLAESLDGISRDKVLLLRHLVLSHHGQMEWGSPVLPKTLEGLLLHFADNMDAKVGTFRQAADTTPEGEWLTDRVWSMDHRRFVLSGRSHTSQETGSVG
jgi:3'-5' exoribonuclease